MNKEAMFSQFSTILQNDQIIDGKSSEAQPFLKEKRGNFESFCAYILMPKNTQEVSEIVKLCNKMKIFICPQSGNTGLVGGNVSRETSIILSSRLLNSLAEVDEKNFSITIDSGFSLRSVQNIALKHDLYFPLSLPSEEECLIGGNLATNAGGISVLKYGNIRDLTLGLEVVLPNGDIYSDLNTLRKRNIGSDIKHLFIGSEGTLGFITKACLKLFPKPKKAINFIISLHNIEEASEYFNAIYKQYFSYLSSFELFNNNALDMVKKFHDVDFPLANKKAWYIIASLDIQLETDLIAKQIEAYLKSIIKDTCDLYITEDENIWECRYLIPISQSLFGYSLKHDIATPISKTSAFISETLTHLEKEYGNKLIPIVFGHMGDGNIHFNISSTEIDLKTQRQKIKNIIIEKAMNLQGTFSAEHGIGLIHKEELKKFYFNNQYNNLKLIKSVIDSNNIFNPNKIFD